jgi:hypothetical protein
MFGNFLGFPGGTVGSCGGYMAVRFHQLQTLDQLSGRPRILREAGEARRERIVPDLLNLLYLACVLTEVCARKSCMSEPVTPWRGYGKGNRTRCIFFVYFRKLSKTTFTDG